MRLLQHQRVFYGQVLRAADQVGAFSLTSRPVAEAVVAPVASRPGGPRRVLEVGAGTGAVTEVLVGQLAPGDRLDLVELNPEFARYLEGRFARPGGAGPQVRVWERDVEELEDGPYDAIVSTLPLLNMPPAKVERVFHAYLERLLVPGGVLTYYDYWAKGLRCYVVGPGERRRMKEVLRVTQEFLDRYEVERRVVLRNVPPACVHVLKRSGA